MERIATLINKLYQLQQDEVADRLKLATAEMLVLELRQALAAEETGKVSIDMPQIFVEEQAEADIVAPEPPMPVIEPKQQPLIPVTEIEAPTLILQTQKEVFELNDIIAAEEEQLNDKLKPENTEIVSTIKDAPVKDLRKAIGVNDKYLFINELFKSDDAMYERCIKTINNFNVYPEAETWIKRELITKMAWTEESDTVQLFLQLVRRRFS